MHELQIIHNNPHMFVPESYRFSVKLARVSARTTTNETRMKWAPSSTSRQYACCDPSFPLSSGKCNQ